MHDERTDPSMSHCTKAYAYNWSSHSMTVNLTLDNYHHHRTESTTIISLPEGTTYYYFDSKWKTLRLRLIQFCWPILVKLTLAPGFTLRSMSKTAIPTFSLAEDSIDVINKRTVSIDSAQTPVFCEDRQAHVSVCADVGVDRHFVANKCHNRKLDGVVWYF